MKTIVFIVQQLSQPRCIKRISTIQDAGFPIKVYGFDNGLYSENIKNLPFKATKVITRNKEANKLEKIRFFHSSIKQIIKENKSNSIFYFFGFEIACIAYLSGCRNYIYEEADVSAARANNNFIRKFLLSLDKRTIHKSKLTIFTSKGFPEYIFGNDKHPENIIFMPNKLSSYFNQKIKDSIIRNTINQNHIRFGFIGLIRYPNTIIRFAKVIGKHFPMHEFHFFGDAERKNYIDTEITSFPNVHFHGAFKNPEDLQSIYQSIDINVVCYDTNSGNVRIAEPNKLYESIFFETPIIVSSNTFLAKRVKQYNAGDDIDASNDSSIIDYVKKLDAVRLNKIASNLTLVDFRTLIDSPIELINKINQLI